MSSFIKYWCSADCHKNVVYGDRADQSFFILDFSKWALGHPDHIAEHGRHGPEEIPCLACGSPAYKQGTKKGSEAEEYSWKRHIDELKAEVASGDSRVKPSRFLERLCWIRRGSI